MTPRAYVELALIAVAGAAGWGYVHQRDEALKAEGRLEVLTATADSAKAVAAAAVRAARARDSAQAASDRREDAARAAAGAAVARAQARIPGAADSVVAAAAPADSAAVRARLAALGLVDEDRDRGRLERTAADSVTIAGLRGQVATLHAAVDALQASAAASEAKADAAVAARPGFLARNVPKAAVVGAFVGGWLLHRLVGG